MIYDVTGTSLVLEKNRWVECVKRVFRFSSSYASSRIGQPATTTTTTTSHMMCSTCVIHRYRLQCATRPRTVQRICERKFSHLTTVSVLLRAVHGLCRGRRHVWKKMKRSARVSFFACEYTVNTPAHTSPIFTFVMIACVMLLPQALHG